MELHPIVNRHLLEDSEAANDVLPEEFDDIGCRYGGDSFRLHPLGEVLDCNESVLKPSGCHGEWADNIHPHLANSHTGTMGWSAVAGR